MKLERMRASFHQNRSSHKVELDKPVVAGSLVGGRLHLQLRHEDKDNCQESHFVEFSEKDMEFIRNLLKEDK